MAEGHGSGVYIGNGLFLTANHVLSDENPKVILTNGNEYPATILWRSADYDIALVKAKDHIEANKASLSCEPLQIGDELFFSGQPVEPFQPNGVRASVRFLDRNDKELESRRSR